MVTERDAAVFDPSQPTTDEPIGGCYIVPGASSETPMPRQGVEVKWTVYVPPTQTPIAATDLVSLPGIRERYQIDGAPAAWPHPAAGDPYRVLQLISQEG
ncbi:MAG: hypothetical protein LBH11_03355 [Propionibacteriaceae bacterium]|nr:hypothetical protein [Propionibacteriaceae bacterium]